MGRHSYHDRGGGFQGIPERSPGRSRACRFAGTKMGLGGLLGMPVEVVSPEISRRAERAADAVVHGLGIAAAVIGAGALIVIAAVKRNGFELATVTTYSFGLLAMLICSTVYNMAERSRYRELLRRFDHAAIFVMIAGTYTPFTTLGLPGGWAIAMTAFVWVAAAIGVILKLSVSSARFAKL